MRRFVPIIAMLVSVANARACLYDNDVSYDLTHGLPSVASILAGKWERHSDAYYEEVVRLQSARAEYIRNQGTRYELPDYSSLTAAYIRRGRYEMVPKLLDESSMFFMDVAPTYSARATAHLALGNFKSAESDLLKAIHGSGGDSFRREHFELHLANYLYALQADRGLGVSQPTFARALIRSLVTIESASQFTTTSTDETLFAAPHASDRIDEAATAVAAMIRFGNPQSAQLYAALGDLLRARGEYELAYRAFRRALENRHPYPQVIQAQLDAVRKQVSDDSLIADKLIDSERHKADQWVAAFRVREAALLKAGEDAGNLRNYAEFYKVYGNPRFTEPAFATLIAAQAARFWKPLVLLAGILVVFVLMLFRRLRERRSAVASE